MTDPITPSQLDELDRLVSKLPAWVNQEWFRWMQDHGRAVIDELRGGRMNGWSAQHLDAIAAAVAQRDAALREVDVQRRYIAYLTEVVKPAEALAFAHGHQLSATQGAGGVFRYGERSQDFQNRGHEPGGVVCLAVMPYRRDGRPARRPRPAHRSPRAQEAGEKDKECRLVFLRMDSGIRLLQLLLAKSTGHSPA